MRRNVKRKTQNVKRELETIKLLGFALLLFVVSFSLFAWALPVLAQIQINPNEPVPVPRNIQFGPCVSLLGFTFGPCAPAGASTATGLIIGIIQIALWIVGLLSVLFVIIGGFRYVTAHGNEEQAEAAKKTLTHAITGIVIVILSFVIVRVISNALIYGSGPGGGT